MCVVASSCSCVGGSQPSPRIPDNIAESMIVDGGSRSWCCRLAAVLLIASSLLVLGRATFMRPFLEYLWYAMLSEDSPDWYDIPEECYEILPYYICAYDETPPFHICFVKAGSRTGYRWETKNFKPCEVNWLDPEPDRESGDYGKYVKKLQEMNSKVEFFKGFHQPPTEEEYNRLCDRFEEEGRWW
jgi:hypothetical protein